MGQSLSAKKFFFAWLDKVKLNKSELPFFWFLTFVLSGFFIFILSSDLQVPIFNIVIASLLMLMFLAMFWFSLALNLSSMMEFSIYLATQVILCLGMVFLLQNNFMLLSAFGMSLIGQITGFPISFVRKMITLTLLTTGMLLGMWLIDPAIFKDPLPFLVGITVIIIFQLVFTGVYNQTSSAKRQLEEANEKLEIANIKIEQMTRAEERQRIARELHDTLAQGLTGIILQLDAVDHYLGRGDALKAQELVRRSMKAARDTLAESRQVIDDLRMEDTGTSFQEKIGQLIRNDQTKFSFQSVLKEPLSANEEGLILKVVRECVLNIRKHAQAKSARINLQSDESEIKLTITDDGIGFDLEKIQTQSGHYGILGMQERITAVQGTFQFETAPAKGCKVKISIPKEGSKS